MKVVSLKGLVSRSTLVLKHILSMCFSSVRCFTKEKKVVQKKATKEGRELGSGQMGKDVKPHTTANCHQVCFLSEALLLPFL